MLTSSLPQGTMQNTLSLMVGHPDPSTLMTPGLREAIERVAASALAHQPLAYGAEQGTAALIDYLVARLNRKEGLALGPENVMIVAGSTAAVDMIARLHQGIVIVEAPSYADAIHVFRDHGLTIYSVPIDGNGIVPDRLEALLEQLRQTNAAPILLYTIPNFHNPTGVTLSADRRPTIVELARRYKVTLLEDDVYRDLTFSGAVPPSLFTLAGDEQHLWVGSFSKTLAPGLRVGWLVGSPETIQRYVDCGVVQMGGGASPLSAGIVAEYCHMGHWEAHIEDLRRTYQARRDVLLDALRRSMPDGVTWTEPDGGFFVWLTLPGTCLAADVKREAFQRGVLVAAGDAYFVTPGAGRHNLRLTYSFAPPEQIEEAVRILAEVVSRLSGQP